MVTVGESSDSKSIADLFKDHFKVLSPLGHTQLVHYAEVDPKAKLIRFSAKEMSKVISQMT